MKQISGIEFKTLCVWWGIQNRCFNPKAKAYERYGGRGIGMYDLWHYDFGAFYKYVSQLPHFGEKGYSIDRIDVNRDYEPDNIRMATYKEQANNKSNNRIIEFNGKAQTVAQWAEEYNISRAALANRLFKLKWDVEKALTTEVGEYKKKAHTIRKNLKAFRKANNLTLEEMGEKCGISKSGYCQIENGVREGSLAFWVRLKKAFALNDEEVNSLYIK
jgi:DNA-binding XRE family transcriptional regulator